MSDSDKRVLMPGSYIGTIEDFGISKNSKDQPQAFVKFKIKKGEGEGFTNLTWYGGLSEKVPQGKEFPPAHYTIKTLLDCGFSGQEVEDLAGGIEGGALPHGKEMSLEVQDNDYEGVLRSQIRWVNIPGGGGPKKMKREELTGKTNTSALRAMLLQQKSNRPAETMPEEPPF